MNYYYAVLCFVWAAIAILSRILIIGLGRKWNKRELEHAYPQTRPKWPIVVIIFAAILVIVTWFSVFLYSVKNSWIIACILTLIVIKPAMIMTDYKNFRQGVSNILNNKQQLKKLNMSVLVLAFILVILGFYYIIH